MIYCWTTNTVHGRLSYFCKVATRSGTSRETGPGPSEAPSWQHHLTRPVRGTLPTRGDRKSPTASRKLATRPTRPEPPVSKLILSLGSRPDTPSIPTQAVEAENSRYPNLSTRKTLRRHSHSRGPAGAESSRGYENAASLVFLQCFSPADSQNRLAASEGRGVLEENKRILPPILSRGVAFPSQMWHTGSNNFKRNHTRRPLPRAAQLGEDTQSSCQTGLYRGCLPQTRGLSPGCMASTIFSPPVATAPGGKTQWRGKALEGGNVFPWNV